MTSARQCPQCGRDLPADAPSGVCPQCLLGIGMQSAEPHETMERAGSFVPPKPAALARHFPQLEILDLVGHGGMGAVYKARQRGLDRLVALKILPPEVAQDPSFAARLGREAGALAKLSHPHIVAVHDSGCVGGLHYVLMEYVDGVNLREAIQTNELTPQEALAIVPQICEALQYAHDEGVVHRDIKPENILLDKKGTVKIADFGLARLLNGMPDNFTLTGTHQVMGTPKYMAPEQMEGSHEVDHRADIFSLGVVFYEMLTGELPLGRFDAPSKKVQLDVRLDDIVLRTLEKEPDRRYQAASEIKADVETVHGVAGVPPYLRQYHGYEYRSKTEIFGWPLVHICHGIDPRTGKTRVAKGVIAIGGVAIGGFAFGGAAFGGITIGGLSIGLVSMGGAALGLLLAIGGAAVGLGISLGGFAIGTVAIGGGAFGIWGVGDRGVIAHRIGEPNQVVWPLLFLVLGATAMGAVFVGVITAFARRRSERQGQPAPPFDASRREHGRAGCLVASAALLLFMCGFCVIPGSLAWFYARRSHVALEHAQVSHSRAQTNEARASQQRAAAEQRRQAEAVQELAEWKEAGSWTLEAEGPVLSDNSQRGWRLSPDQVQRVNQILQQTYQAYLQVEAEHTTRETNELGHSVITVARFADKEIADLEDELWSKLDELLDVKQQNLARQNLGVHPGEGLLHMSKHKWKPGILGWGRQGCQIELWKVGAWYHWKAEVKATHSRVYAQPERVPEERSPQLPMTFQRFWREETKTGPTLDEASSGDNIGSE